MGGSSIAISTNEEPIFFASEPMPTFNEPVAFNDPVAFNEPLAFAF